MSPIDLLLPYQRKWVDDESRFKYGLWSRQTGKDFSSAAEIVRDCKLRDKTTWMIAAPSERQSLETLAKCGEWSEAFDLASEGIREERDGPEALLKQGEIKFANGSRVIAVPGRPDTVRGFSANVLMTEFAFFEDPDATWRAILPSITNPLRGGEKKVRLITTPNGQGNKAHDLWTKENSTKHKWSKHKVTIHDAVAAGLPVDPEELRAMLDDPEGWAQEYECEFLDSAGVLLPYELIATCEAAEATTTQADAFWNARQQFPLYAGWDFARKKDLSVLWTAQKVGPIKVTKEVLIMRGMSTPAQVELVSHRLKHITRLCLDYTGAGVGAGDLLVEKFGEWNFDKHQFGKVELCTFTDSLKRDIFPSLKVALEQREFLVPATREIREDLHSMYRVVTAAGNVTYRAPHSPNGHADRCTGLALCNRAAGIGGAAGGLRSVKSERPRGRRLVA
ncbi:terminase large subunit domain-containing protein [Verrucomicrobium spinosum]|uniref:terminase large subunit domain-containing protein n=1 Tax=Verrucomicrobium spinosum TaxID=2736 RepID=UPI0006A7269C|nr:terminase family protein [Verrucomicrobium spinosum]